MRSLSRPGRRSRSHRTSWPRSRTRSVSRRPPTHTAASRCRCRTACLGPMGRRRFSGEPSIKWSTSDPKACGRWAIETRRVFRQLEDLASRSGETGLAESVEGQIRRVQGRIIEGAAGRPESKFKITGKLELPEPDLSPLERMREEFRRTFEDLETGFAHFSEAFMSSADMLLNATSSMSRWHIGRLWRNAGAGHNSRVVRRSTSCGTYSARC